MTGTTSATGTTEEQKKAEPKTEEMGHQEALRHIQAIEAILNGTSATGTTSGTTGTTATRPSATGPLTLTQAQLDQIRMHLSELRRLVGEAGKN